MLMSRIRSLESDLHVLERQRKSPPPPESPSTKEGQIPMELDSAAQLSAELSAGSASDLSGLPSVDDIANIFPPSTSAEEARKIKEQHEVNRAAQELLMSLNPSNVLDEASSSSSSSASSSSSSSASSSAASSPQNKPLELGDLDALVKGIPSATSDSSADLMAALDSLGSGIPSEDKKPDTSAKNDVADLMASLDSLGGNKTADDLLSSLGMPDLSSLDSLGNLGESTSADLSSLGDLGDLSSLSSDLSSLDALAGLGGLDSSEKPAARPLIRDHYEAEDTNVSGLRRGKKKPTLSARGVPKFAMEDAHAAVFPFNHSTTQAFFGVFDGFSGRDCAEDATTAVPKALADNLAVSGLSADLSAIWPKVFADADEALKKHEYVGCTCTSVFVWEFEGERYVQSANCGDSNVYLFRGDKAIMLNTEHKVTSAAERKRLKEEMGIDMNVGQTRINGVAVARALGVHFIKEEKLGIVSKPSVSTVYKLQPDDHFLVIASDGLWDVISGQDACEMVRDLPDASAMASTLLKYAVKSTKCVDNVTVVVIRL